MKDLKIEERAKKFQTTAKNIQQHRENMWLSLRKEKIFNKIMDKRLGPVKESVISSENNFQSMLETHQFDIAGISNSPERESKSINNLYYGISVNSFNISEDSKNFYEQEDDLGKIKLLKQWVIESDSPEYSYKRFSIFHLRKLFSNISSYSIKKALLDEDLFRNLVNEMIMTNDLEIKCEISFIMTRITFLSSNFCEILCDSQVLGDFIQLTYLNNPAILENILITFGNIIIDFKQFVLNNTNFLIRLKELMFDKNFLNLRIKNCNLNLLLLILWNLNLIVSEFSLDEMAYLTDITQYIVDLIDINRLKEFKEIDKTQEELSQLLRLMATFSNYDQHIEIMIKCNILPKIIYLLEYINIPYSKNKSVNPKELIILTPENLGAALKIFSNIFSSSDEVLTQINAVNSKTLEVFENLLLRYRFYKDEDRLTVVEIMWALSNFICSSPDDIEKIIFTRIPQYLLTFYIKNDDRIMEQIIIFFENSIIKGNNKTISQVLKLNVLKIICDSIQYFDKSDILRSCLNCLIILITFIKKSYSQNIDSDSPDVIESIKNEFITDSLISRIEQLILHNNYIVSGYAKNLIKILRDLMNEMDY